MTLRQYGNVEGSDTKRLASAALPHSGMAEVSATAPTQPRLGHQWYDTGAALLKTWDGSAWQSIGTGAATLVTSSAVLADNAVLRGDGGSRGIQDSGITIDDSDNMTGIATLTVTTKVQAPEIEGTAGAITLDAQGAGDGLINITNGGAGTDVNLLLPGKASVDNLALSSGGGVLDANANELISFTQTSSAVNEVHITNAATGTTGPLISVSGETNVDLRLDAAGTGDIAPQCDVHFPDSINAKFGTDSDLTIGSSSALVGDFSVPSSGIFQFNVNSTAEVQLYADTLKFKDGGSDVSLSWATANQLRIYAGATAVCDFPSTGPDSGTLTTKCGNIRMGSAISAGGAGTVSIGNTLYSSFTTALPKVYLPQFWSGTTIKWLACRDGTTMGALLWASQA